MTKRASLLAFGFAIVLASCDGKADDRNPTWSPVGTVIGDW